MKKLLSGAAALLLMAGCSGNGASEKEREDNSQASDSITEIVVEDTVLDTSNKQAELEDSIMNAQIEKEYNKGLSVKTNAKLRKTSYGEPPLPYYTFDFIVENHTSIKWLGTDYYITYSILDEYFNEKYGGLDDKWFSKKVKGKDINADMTVTLTHKSDGWKYKGVKLKKNLSKEEFAKRFKEQTVFDNAQNKFIPKN